MPRVFVISLAYWLYSASAFAEVPMLKFEKQVLDSKVSIGYGVAIGDVDGDGKLDVLMADAKQYVWYRNGDWKKFVLAENVTAQDNVCIAARDIDGDGKVEIAVGAAWNPGDTVNSGSVHYLIRPADPTQMWEVVNLHHEPTVHRMGWVKTGQKKYELVVVPLHGRGNKAGEGDGVKVMAYERPENPKDEWKTRVLDSSMHMTHKKLNLPTKTCSACKRSFAWRKKWARDWDNVKFCSDRCRAQGAAGG